MILRVASTITLTLVVGAALAHAPVVHAHDQRADPGIEDSEDEESDLEEMGQFASNSSIAGRNVTVEVLSEEGEASGETTTAASDSSEPENGPVAELPLGAQPRVEQRAWPDFRAMLPDCGVMEEVSCYDPETRESTYVLPADDEDEGSDDDEVTPAVVTGTQVATAVREYARMRINPAPAIIQPEQEWHLVNLPVIVRTEPNTQEFSTELLGLPVDIRAEPVSYSWDFGDGSPVLNTTDVGAAFPDQTIEHAYTQAGEYQITMVAYWSGSFRVDGGAWIDIDGLGVTSSTTPVLDVQTRTTRLIG